MSAKTNGSGPVRIGYWERALVTSIVSYGKKELGGEGEVLEGEREGREPPSIDWTWPRGGAPAEAMGRVIR